MRQRLIVHINFGTYVLCTYNLGEKEGFVAKTYIVTIYYTTLIAEYLLYTFYNIRLDCRLYIQGIMNIYIHVYTKVLKTYNIGLKISMFISTTSAVIFTKKKLCPAHFWLGQVDLARSKTGWFMDFYASLKPFR